MNQEYSRILSRLLVGVRSNKYIVLGSAATLSYTSRVNYIRQMNDLDIVVDKTVIEKIKNKLIDLGFIQNTFIDKRMPFYKKLIKHKDSMYLRFSKGKVNVEILSTRFKGKYGYTTLELYPNIWVKVPINSIAKSSLNGVSFTTLDVNLLWAIKQFLNNTLGKVVFYKKVQRLEDLSNLRKLINIGGARSLLSQCRFGYKNLRFAIPSFFLK